jgi:hypothetical protein
MNFLDWFSLPGFYQPSSAWLFTLMIPILILYFLKLRRPQMEISSLVLWRSVLNDQRVNSPFQRFRRNLLLLFQLLLLFCLATAATQPFLQAGSDRVRNLPILIDCSASMEALDVKGGKSRLDVVKEDVHALVDKLLPDQRAMIITVGNTARRLTDFTNNKRILHAAIDEIQVEHVTSQLEDGLRLTQALARTAPVESVALYTDGNTTAEVQFDLPFKLLYQRVPAGGENLAITQLNARRGRSQWDVFVRVEAAGLPAAAPKEANQNPGNLAAELARVNFESTAKASVSAGIELWQDGRKVATSTVSLDPGESQRVVFAVESDRPTQLEVRLVPDGFDSLACDNTAFLDLPVIRPLVVYCPTTLVTYRQALKGIKNITVWPDDNGGETRATDFDLVLSDRIEDMQREFRVGLFTGFIPKDLERLVATRVEMAQVVDWQRQSPLLQHVQLMDVMVAENPRSADGTTEKQFEELGYSTLITGRNGPLLIRKSVNGKTWLHFLFHTDQSTLPYRVGFPVMIANTIQMALEAANLSDVRGMPTGILPPRIVTPETQCKITGPNNYQTQLMSNSDGSLVGIAAPLVGRYRISDGGSRTDEVGISLLSSTESALLAAKRIRFRELTVGETTATLKNDWPLWTWFSIAGFVFLLAEWWLFQRRPGGPPA